jgi:hypothetical protein
MMVLIVLPAPQTPNYEKLTVNRLWTAKASMALLTPPPEFI